MDRLRAVAYGSAVSVAAFTYLALPLLREVYGPEVLIPVYALMAVVAGFVTYSIVRTVQRRAPDPSGDPAREYLEEATGDDDERDGDDAARPEPDVDREIEQLKDDL